MSAMIPKERLQTVIAGKIPARVPAAVHQWQPHHYRNISGVSDEPEAFLAVGLDAVAYPGAWVIPCRSPAGGVDPHPVGGPLGHHGLAPRLRGVVRGGARVGGCPARGDLDRRPGAAALGIDQDDDAQMVRHHGVGQDVDGEGAGRLADQPGDPGATVPGLISAAVLNVGRP